MHLGAKLTVETLADLAAGTATPRPQDDCEATAAPKIFKSDCQLDSTMTAEQARNHIRGLSPYPGAWTDSLYGLTIKVFEAKIADKKIPGKLYMDFADGSLELLQIQPAGKRRMSGEDFLRGIK